MVMASDLPLTCSVHVTCSEPSLKSKHTSEKSSHKDTSLQVGDITELIEHNTVITQATKQQVELHD